MIKLESRIRSSHSRKHHRKTREDGLLGSASRKLDVVNGLVHEENKVWHFMLLDAESPFKHGMKTTTGQL
jgi:hypothetical protein